MGLRGYTKLERRIHDIDTDEDITLVNDDNEIFDVDTLAGEEVFVAEQSGNVVEEVVSVIDAASTIPVSAAIITDVEITFAQALAELKSAKPKADKPVVEYVKPIKRLEQIRLDEELSFKLQAEEEEEERLSREKPQQIEEDNIAWDDVQAKVEADYQLAQRLQAQEQEELTNEEKARLFLVEESSKKAKTELEENLKKAKAEVMEGSLKRAGTKLEQNGHYKAKRTYKDVTYILPSLCTKALSMEDLETLSTLVKIKHGSTRPEEGYERVLWDDLKVMYEPHVEDTIWRNQQDYRVLELELMTSLSTFLKNATHIDLYVGREEISSYTCYNY
ncbi:hypothetical protein Tco_0509295 [Tanacetum coccineum]